MAPSSKKVKRQAGGKPGAPRTRSQRRTVPARRVPLSRTFLLGDMRAIERAVHVDLEALMVRSGFPEVRFPHTFVFAHVPRGEGMRMSDLADRMGLTRGAVTQLVDHLERHGYLERIQDPGDGRGVIVRPTPAAHEGYEVGRARLAELEDAWRRAVGSARWRVFVTVLHEVALWQQRQVREAIT